MASLQDLLNTPFVVEILVNTLPKMASNTVSEADIRKKFLEHLSKKFDNVDAEWRTLTSIIYR